MARRDDLSPVAIVDIGSNSVRLVVYEGATRVPVPLFNEKVLCGLGREVASTGKLAPKAVERALHALHRFRAIIDQTKAKTVEVIATAAARDAENGPDFVAEAEAILDAPVQLLTGRMEAELAAAGVISGHRHAQGLAGDMGGGSLELVDIADGTPGDAVTLPLGGLRLIDVSGGSLKKARDIVDEELDKVSWLENGKDRDFYAIGGTWRAFARVYMAEIDYPLSVMQDFRIKAEDALKFASVLDHQSQTSLAGIREVSSARRETLPYGALVLERIIRRMKPKSIVISAYGIREGLLYTLLDETQRKEDPLLVACQDLAERRSRSVDYAYELCEWTDTLFGGAGYPETEDERRLRHAACLLSDIGWRAHPDYRGTQSLDTVAQGNFAGVDHVGRALLALAVYFRAEGFVKDELSLSLMELIGDDQVKRARILGAAFRAANMVSASLPGVLPHTPLSFEGDRLVWTLPAPYDNLDGERVGRRFKTLAGLLGKEDEIRVGNAVEKAAV
ncbi:exopolyphosphatase [Methyloligella sp. 2.7D]|uniref:exopolyphosphatase n=1 Tax=unclassified Methyloligella TaxID=2625955 RepID=UPI001FEDC7C6|nr:exopolyphosphatase [Methyloligella sp. GL2]